jgi:hypothetical protein
MKILKKRNRENKEISKLKRKRNIKERKKENV